MNKRAEKQECVDKESNKIIFFGNRASEHESNPNKSPSKFYYFYHARATAQCTTISICLIFFLLLYLEFYTLVS